MSDTVASDSDDDKPCEITQTWTRADVIKRLQSLFLDAKEDSIRLKCLELILENAPPEAKKEGPVPEALRRARERVEEEARRRHSEPSPTAKSKDGPPT
jgi:hypothetical protein